MYWQKSQGGGYPSCTPSLSVLCAGLAWGHSKLPPCPGFCALAGVWGAQGEPWLLLGWDLLREEPGCCCPERTGSVVLPAMPRFPLRASTASRQLPCGDELMMAWPGVLGAAAVLPWRGRARVGFAFYFGAYHESCGDGAVCEGTDPKGPGSGSP